MRRIGRLISFKASSSAHTADNCAISRALITTIIGCFKSCAAIHGKENVKETRKNALYAALHIPIKGSYRTPHAYGLLCSLLTVIYMNVIECLWEGKHFSFGIKANNSE